MTQNNNTALQITIGLLTLLLAHLVFGAVLWVLNLLARPTGLYFLQAIAGYGAVLIGLSQLLYVIPLIIGFRRQRRFNAAKGIVIGAVITVLLNGGCFVFAFWMLSQMH